MLFILFICVLYFLFIYYFLYFASVFVYLCACTTDSRMHAVVMCMHQLRFVTVVLSRNTSGAAVIVAGAWGLCFDTLDTVCVFQTFPHIMMDRTDREG